MIRHIVFFTAKAPENLPAILDGLSLLGTIPHVSHFEVTPNRKVDQIANEVDVVVYAEFESEAALRAYKAHPTYAEATRRVRPLRELRFAADFEAALPEAGEIRRSA
ncbi:MAG TPA: Dabb family protein [Devosia sp.]|nr:Dabb family protein [Devosia sp.]